MDVLTTLNRRRFSGTAGGSTRSGLTVGVTPSWGPVSSEGSKMVLAFWKEISGNLECNSSKALCDARNVGNTKRYLNPPGGSYSGRSLVLLAPTSLRVDRVTGITFVGRFNAWHLGFGHAKGSLKRTREMLRLCLCQSRQHNHNYGFFPAILPDPAQGGIALVPGTHGQGSPANATEAEERGLHRGGARRKDTLFRTQ